MQDKKATNVIVLGGGYAGTIAALRLAAQTKGQDVAITLINREDHFIERIRLHQQLAGASQPAIPFAALLAGTTVHFRQGQCTALDPATRTLTLESSTGSQSVDYDYLVYALGSTVDRSRVPGVADYALSLASAATSAQGQAVLQQLAQQAGKLLIVGGGLTGIEAATELAERYPQLQITLATSGKLGDTLSQAGQRYLQQIFRQLGITVMEGVTIERLTANVAHSRGGMAIAFDQCLWAGAFTVPALAQSAGLPVDGAGRLLVDAQLRVQSHEEIYAVGDAAATGLRMACATAMPMGAHVADELAAHVTGQPAPGPFRFGYLARCISLGRKAGLVQWVHSDDQPRERIITGRLGAWIKELICRFTVQSLWFTKRWPRAMQWQQTSQVIDAQAPTVTAGSDYDQRYRPTAANL